jgi:hypothetical protein
MWNLFLKRTRRADTGPTCPAYRQAGPPRNTKRRSETSAYKVFLEAGYITQSNNK